MEPGGGDAHQHLEGRRIPEFEASHDYRVRDRTARVK